MTVSTEELRFVSQPAPAAERLIVRRDGNVWGVELAGRALAVLSQHAQEPVRLRELVAAPEHAEPALLAGVRAAFDWQPDLRECALELGAAPEWLRARLLQRGAFEASEPGARALRCRRASLAQLPDLWLTAPHSAGYPFAYTISEGKRHPHRPHKPEGYVYQRSIAALGAQFALRVIDAERDLPAFHRWMNEPRVSRIWELAVSPEELRDYLEKLRADAHTLPLIGEFDGEPFGYFELYWAKEDRIAPFYSAGDYDRGVHVLVGEAKYRGPARVAAWLPSLAHYAFLDDPRTQHVVAEPRAENAKMIAYFGSAGFHRAKAFDFPHKRAALMQLPREVFFDEHCP